MRLIAFRHCEAQGRGNLRLFLCNAFLLITIFITSCTTTKSLLTDDILPSDGIEWIQLKSGYEITKQKINGLGISWTCVKIDLSQQSAGPVSEVSKKPFSVKSFAKNNNLTVAVNTTPFAKNDNLVQAEGIIKNNGQTLSEPMEKYCALAFSFDDNRKLFCSILENQTPQELDNYSYAYGGFFVILKDGIVQEFSNIKRSRTACGTDDTGSCLYLFAGTPNFSLTDKNGLSYSECALILKSLGCTQAMQFDGGHSTAMIINGKSIQAPLFQRKIAAAIGF